MARWRASSPVRQRIDMANRSSLRASDADREHVAERLRQAAGEGRLLAEELEHRLGSAFRARTYGELDEVVADLPGARVARQGARSPIPLARPALVLGFALLAVAIIAVAVLVVTGILAAWGLWMLVAWWAFGGRCRHRAVRRRSHWHQHTVRGRPEPRAWL
jgi:hypothetical protein